MSGGGGVVGGGGGGAVVGPGVGCCAGGAGGAPGVLRGFAGSAEALPAPDASAEDAGADSPGFR